MFGNKSICLRWLNWPILFFVVLGGSTALTIGQTIYEAENATLSGASLANANSGYTGTGYADYNNATGDYVEFTLSANSAGVYPIAFRYANGGGSDRPLSVKVNGGTVIGSLSFPATAGWTTWSYTATNLLTLNAGINTVRITSIGSNGANVDHMLVTTAGTGLLAANATNAPLRRPIGPGQPALMVHIDTWNYADPQKIIDLIPLDIRPYVVMNISLSINHATNQWLQCLYGYETAKSWLRTCAENNMWAMIQPSSGGYCHFSNSDISQWEDFFREYPNFIGFSYAEQFWGFDDVYAGSVTWLQRVAHWVDLMKLNQKYGGYLMVSWCANQYDANINPVAMMKRNPAFAAICKQSPKNFILCEKYTTQSYQSDMESVCLGEYLSGFSGQYGIRYDSTGWTDVNGSNANFTMSSGGAPHLEHIMLTGETVVDGPELIWAQDIQGLSDGATGDGYTMRRWGLFPQYQNVILDLFRKVLDGTVRIPTRQEVINRTKVIVLNDITSGSSDNIYCSPQTLFDGLYRMDIDGTYVNNKYFFKKTGRYPTIPTAYQLADAMASNSFSLKLNASAYSTRWPSTAAKTNELNTLFPQEYTGDIYAGRYENAWVIYNPYKTNQIASGSIPLKYNTCSNVDLTLSQYTAGIMKEYSNSVTFYLANYDNSIGLGMRTDTIKIYGSTVEPTYTWTDRASHTASTVTKDWTGGVWTLTVQHNGPLDITVNCSGPGTGRLTNYTIATVVPPTVPPVYSGPHQYEAEHFDFKNISGYTSQGIGTGVSNYTGMGYLRFGNNTAASIRDTITVLKSGSYKLLTKYSVTSGNVSTIDLYVNGVKVATPSFTQTASLSDWAIDQQNINLNVGANTIEFRANGAPGSVYFDNIVVAPNSITGGVVVQENKTGFDSVDGTVDNVYSGYTSDGYANAMDSNGAGIDWTLSFDSSLVKAITFRYASTNSGSADLIVAGANVASEIQFPSTGSMTNWDFATVYVYAPAGTTNVRLQSSSSTGLPNVDSLQVAGGWVGTQPPTGLTALAVSKSRINLSWLASSNVTSYNVKRSLTNGGPYSVVASGITPTNYSDPDLTSGTTYYYVVSAVTAAVESSDSAQASATTSAGVVSLVGSANYLFNSGVPNTAALVGTLDLDDSANVLVVGVYLDSGGVTFPANLASFGGVAPSGSIQAAGNASLNRMAAFYWLNPKTAAGQNLMIGSSISNNAGCFVLQLSGVDTNAAVIKTGGITTDAASVNITTSAANSLLVSYYSANADGLTLTPTAPLKLVGSTLNTINGSGGGSLAVGTNALATIGTQNLAWTSSGSTANQGVNGFAFAPIALADSPSGPGNLTNSYSAGVLSLSWPAGEGWRLQMQTNSSLVGLETNWVYVTDGTVSSTNITINPDNGSVFYQLRYP